MLPTLALREKSVKMIASFSSGVFSPYYLILTVFLPSPHTPEVMSPAVVSVSESGETSVRVSWGPLQPETVSSYYVEYSALPRGKLHAATVGRTQNSTLLRDLQPDTTYLVTVTARHASGKEKAMSVKVCTQEGELHSQKMQLNSMIKDPFTC